MKELFFEIASSVPGFFSPEDCELYDEAMQLSLVRSGLPIVEVGCWVGRSTIYLAKLLARHKLENPFYVVDTFFGDPNSVDQIDRVKRSNDIWKQFNDNLRKHGVREAVFPIKKGSTSAANLFKPRSLAFVFIDADHSYPSVVLDLKAWYPKMMPHGVLAGHDYVMGEVKLAVDEFAFDLNLEVKRKHHSWWIEVPRQII